MSIVEGGKVRIRGVQAIKFIEFDMPVGGGGVRVFKGENGAGKTTAIACLMSLTGRKVPLEPSDDSVTEGEIEGFGVHQKIGKRIKSAGDFEGETLTGFEFSDLVDPLVKDSDARNRTRIKALVGLAGRKCSVDDFRELFENPEEFDTVVDTDELGDVTDALALAAGVKKSAESTARDLEARVEDDSARWKLAVEQSKGASADVAPKPVSELANEYAKAKDALERANKQNQSRADAIKRNAETRAAIAEHEGKKPSVDASALESRRSAVEAEIVDLRKRIATLEEEVKEIDRQSESAVEWSVQQSRYERMIVPEPESVDVTKLEQAAAVAMQALESAEELKNQHEAAVKAEVLKGRIIDNRAKAERLRKVAKSVGVVVSKQLPTDCPLVVNEDGLLGVHHAKRKHWIPMDELSEGERWKVGLGVAIGSVGVGGVIPLRQEAWQSLDDKARKAIAKQCQDAKVWLVTGEVGEGPLRVEEFA